MRRSELQYDNNAVCYLSQYASNVRTIHFKIKFPTPNRNDSDLMRVTGEIEDIVNVTNNEFTNVSQFEVTFFLHRLDVNQLSSALAFRRLGLRGCELTWIRTGLKSLKVYMAGEITVTIVPMIGTRGSTDSLGLGVGVRK
ncbi:hypothetical protein BPAE_0251g00140 [Botrytis paeoniae]|uniref:Uncharacterized protein n=1 Tax=Botrytis paeoniae TaxID=278948 RepID=A0A4Z1FHI7_9HELO|nr:hypothetical protein BPAE_0251g00140 [Botrytis paeoniae]